MKINSIITICVLLLLAWKTFEYGMYSVKVMDSSNTLNIPFYPFRFVIAIGFFFWALETLLKLFRLTLNTMKRAAPRYDITPGKDNSTKSKER